MNEQERRPVGQLRPHDRLTVIYEPVRIPPSPGLTSGPPCQPDYFPDHRDSPPLLPWDDPAAENDPDQKQNVFHEASERKP